MQLIKYMIVKGITTCTIETNATYEQVYEDGGLIDSINNVMFFEAYDKIELIRSISVTTKGEGLNTTVEISLLGYKNESSKTLATKLQKYYAGINEVLQGLIAEGKLTKSMTEKQKAEVLVKWVHENVSPDYEKVSEERYTGSGALFNGLGACEGYAKLYVTLCHSVGLHDTYYISGTMTTPTESELHAWVGQILDGKRVMTDPTWYSEYNGVQTYFAISIEEMQIDHFYNEKRYPEWK